MCEGVLVMHYVVLCILFMYYIILQLSSSQNTNEYITYQISYV